MSQTLRVIAHLKSKPGKEGELRNVLTGLVEPTRRESGCLSYELLAHSEDSGAFTFAEEWTNPAALEAHFATDHIKAALERLPDLLAEELDLRTYALVK